MAVVINKPWEGQFILRRQDLKNYPTKNDWPSWIAITKHGIDLYNLRRWIVHSTNLDE